MANIGYGFIQGTGEYINLEQALNVSLTADSSYNIQIQGKASFCESATKPEAGGVYWNSLEPFRYVKESNILWIKPYENDTVFVNISE